MSWFLAARRHLYLVLVLGIAAPLYLSFSWTDQLGCLSGDAPAYLVMARHYSAGPGARPGAAPGVADFSAAYSRFPPLYPIALARFRAAGNLLRAHALNSAFLLAGLATFYGLLCSLGLPAAEAALLTLLLAMLPGSWIMALQLESEVLYLPLSCLGLIGMALYLKRGKPELLYAGAFAVAAAILTRSIGVVLLAPLLSMLLRAPRRPPLLALLIAVAPDLLWSLLHRSGMGYGDSLRQYYRTGFWYALAGQAGTVGHSLRLAFEHSLALDGNLRYWIDGLGVLALAAALARAAKREPDAIYLLVYLAVVVVWPYAQVEGQRYLSPLLGLLLAQPVLRLAQSHGPGRQAAVTALGMLLLCGSLPSIALASQRFRDADYSGIPGARSIRYWYEFTDPAQAYQVTAAEALYTSLLKDLASEVPEADCVVAIRPDLIHFFAGRWSGIPPDEATSDAEFARELKRRGCRYIFMTSQHYAEYPTPLYPLQRLRGKIDVIDARTLPLDAQGGSAVAILARLKD
jgi:hypothetical protein